jgi:hypothetical protein
MAASQRSSRYHLMTVQAKQAHIARSQSEPAVACPQCDTKTSAVDLLEHVSSRCSGPRDPHPHSKWVSWREAMDMRVPPMWLSRWTQRGEVRTTGERGERRYLLRDIAVRFASRRRR